jgi:uracil-DNA glycosylase family 4
MPSILDDIAESLAWDQEVYGPYYHKTYPVDASLVVEEKLNDEVIEREHSEQPVQESVADSVELQEDTAVWTLSKANSLDDLHANYAAFFELPKTSVHPSSKRIYTGPTDAAVALIFNKTIYDENNQLRKVDAYTLLTKMLSAISLPIDSLFVTALSKSQTKADNAEFNEKEVAFFRKQMELLSPKLLLCFNPKILERLAIIQENEEPKRGFHTLASGLKIFYTHSPSHLLEKPELKREAWEDLQAFRKFLDSL